MLDIIIPAYNAHNTIGKTLLSIYMQTYNNNFCVYIVDDNSERDYSEEISLFKGRLNIISLRTPYNGGPGVARQYGIDHSNGEYIMFIDSDDLLYDCFALENIMRVFRKDKDAEMVVGTMLEETPDGIYYFFNHQGCLHGKVYKRSLLEKYNIRFNNTKSSEDNSFNRLCYASSSKTMYTDDLIYIYTYNKNSITNKDKNYSFDSLEWFIYNMVWAVKNAEQMNLKPEKIADIVFNSVYYVYFRYLDYNNELQKNKILLWTSNLYDLYYKYDKYLNEKDKSGIYFNYYNYEIVPYISVIDFIEKSKEFK